MKRIIVSLLCVSLLIMLGSCKDKHDGKSTPKTAQSEKSDTETPLQNDQDSRSIYRYIIAPSGLSLRKGDDPASEKLTGMPLGSQVILLDAPAATDMIVDDIEGAMLEVQYEGQKGYAFSGYLAPIRLLKEGESTEDYIADLKKEYPDISYESKPNDPDFHEGTTDTFLLPVSQWHEAYYIISAMYGIPKSLGFPKAEGPEKSVTEDPRKPAEVWDSYVAVERKGNALQKIEYYYRSEGFGYGVGIVRKSGNLFQVEYLGFVD